MSDLKLKGRHPLRQKDAERVNGAVEAALGLRPIPDQGEHLVEHARADPYELVLVDGQAFVLLEGPDVDQPFPLLRALLAERPAKAWVTVDMGAVPFLRNGADVMAPGITEADAAIRPGDLVWVRDEKNGMPLAIGRALTSGAEMASASKGRSIETLHFVGDELWSVGSE